jgi:hypothetical protein
MALSVRLYQETGVQWSLPYCIEPVPNMVLFLGCMQPENTQKIFLATKSIKIQEFFWMKKPNVNHGL